MMSQALHKLSLLCSDQGRDAEAEAEIKRSLAIREKCLGAIIRTRRVR